MLHIYIGTCDGCIFDVRMIIRVKFVSRKFESDFGEAISALTQPAEIEHMDLIVLGCEADRANNWDKHH